jgi:RNA polymerase sigma factor (sigma-70 family)
MERQRQELLTVFIEHREGLRQAAQRIVGERHVAEDVLQSAYLRITDTAERLLVRQPISYCFQVVRHLAIDSRRRATLEAQLFGNEAEGLTAPAPHASPEQVAIGGEFLASIDDALARLPDRTRHAFLLYRLEGRTQRDIARKLGVSATLVNFMIKDALEVLKGCQPDT